MASEEQKAAWVKVTKEKEAEVNQMILDVAQSFQDKPETIAEALAFGSKFYKYSLKNNLLVYKQNSGATYVQSFQAWKKEGYSIKKNEKGIKVYVPVQATVLKVDGGKLVPLEQANTKLKERYAAGEVESVTKTHFKIGTVFDIAQTNFPKENYPQLFTMGYESIYHAAITTALVKFAEKKLGTTVEFTNLESIALRGSYYPTLNKIKINELLEDSHKLSTLSHEIGHRLLHSQPGKSASRKEFEADALGIMLETHCGILLTDTRKRHCADHFRILEDELKETTTTSMNVLQDVYTVFRENMKEIQAAIDHEMEAVQQLLVVDGQVQQLQINNPASAAARPKKHIPTKEEVYDAIKSQVRIINYAGQMGFTVERVGRYYTLKEHDSVRIDADRNCFWRNSGIGDNTQGSVIDFALAFIHNGDLPSALTELTSLTNILDENYVSSYQNDVPRRVTKRQVPDIPKKLELPEAAQNKRMNRVYAYLLKSRYLDQDVVQDFVDRKMLYQDDRGNCVFVAYDQISQEPNFACKRGTLTDKKFMGDAPGSNYDKCFYVNNNVDKLVVTESVIDAMSIMSILKGQELNYKDYDYLILTGAAKYNAIINQLEDAPKANILLALDNDKAGLESAEKIKALLSDHKIETKVSVHLPVSKDWNQELVSVASKFKSLSLINFLGGEVIEKSPLQVETKTSDMNEIIIKEFSFEEDTFLAKLEYKGEMDQSIVWEDETGYYVSTGWAYDNSLEKHTLTTEQLKAFMDFKDAQNIEVEDIIATEELKILETLSVSDPFLDKLQKKELKKNDNQIVQAAILDYEMIL